MKNLFIGDKKIGNPPIESAAGEVYNFPYTGSKQEIFLGKGIYKLEVWGAQGGSYSSYYGGAGGYSYGTLTLPRPTTLYVYVGGQPATQTSTGAVAGGFNGGGNGCVRTYSGTTTYGQGGGGASDIRIDHDSLYARVIVAGGGGGSASVNALTTKYGGGETGASASGSYHGTQTAAGSGGSFGQGGSATTSGTNYKYGSGGGGGGWYGGGAYTSYSDSATSYRSYNGGGSGFVWTGSYAPANYYLNSSWYLTDAATIKGNTSFVSPGGTLETGHTGNGYARITCIEGNKINPEFVEYIESTGSQYIDTGIIGKTGLSSVIEVSFTGPLTTDSHHILSAYGNSQRIYLAISHLDKLAYGYSTVVDSNFTLSTNTKYIINTSLLSGKQEISINGSVVASGTSTTSINTNCSLYIGAYNNNGSPGNLSNLKIYSCKIYDNGTLVRDYVPCLLDNIYGLWDKVEQKFYKSESSTEFIGKRYNYYYLGQKIIQKLFLGLNKIYPGNEIVKINLSTNQSSDSDINNAVVTIKHDNTTKTFTWTGSTITYEIPEGISYTVSYSNVSNYTTPTSQTFTAQVGNTRNISAQYKTCLLTVSLVTNQSSHSDISSARATIISNSINTTVATGTKLKIPYGESVTITFSNSSEFYQTPSSQTFTANQATLTKTGTYNTEVVTVKVVANAGTIYDYKVKISGSIQTTQTTASATYKVAYGKTYTCMPLYNLIMYTTPETVSYTANSASRTVTLTYIYEGVTVGDYYTSTTTLPAGTYKLECWGAQGGSRSGNYGGYGGYSVGTITTTAPQTFYITRGGKPSADSTYGGSNGGGGSSQHETYHDSSNSSGSQAQGYIKSYNYRMWPGGGATDIRTPSSASSDRIIVAGGGSGSVDYYLVECTYGAFTNTIPYYYEGGYFGWDDDELDGYSYGWDDQLNCYWFWTGMGGGPNYDIWVYVTGCTDNIQKYQLYRVDKTTELSNLGGVVPRGDYGFYVKVWLSSSLSQQIASSSSPALYQFDWKVYYHATCEGYPELTRNYTYIEEYRGGSGGGIYGYSTFDNSSVRASSSNGNSSGTGHSYGGGGGYYGGIFQSPYYITGGTGYVSDILTEASTSTSQHTGSGSARITVISTPVKEGAGYLESEIRDPDLPYPIEFRYSNTVQQVTLSAGTYKLECWGAQGGSYNESYAAGGKGGYSVGTITLTENTPVYIYTGGKGIAYTTSTYTSQGGGGFNGGGNAGYQGGGGGGASDIRIGSDSLYARVIVAGGGGGAYSYSSSYCASGGAGGGTNGISGNYYSSSYSSWVGGGASQTAGGTAGTGSSTNYNGTAGTFGVGGNTGYKYNSTSYYSSGAGGGGWYGGGAAGNYSSSSRTRACGGGGGSGYVYTASTAANYPSGRLLTSKYYLTDATIHAGNTSFKSPNGVTETGHAGNGYVRISGLTPGSTGPSTPPTSIDWSNASWTSSSQSSAADGTQYTSNSISSNGSTVTRCTFSGITSITFQCSSSGESCCDYLTVGDLDSSCTRSTYKQKFANTSGSITYTCDAGEHYVEFCYSKDGSVNSGTDNATVYIQSYS